MPQCVAYGCTNHPDKKIPGISYHKFPRDDLRCKVWVTAVKRANWQPTKNSNLCSEHFEESQIDRSSLSSVRLRENAVPSIFKAFPSYCENVRKPKKPPKQSNKDLSPVINCTEDSSSLSDTSTQVVLQPHETLLQDEDQSPVINCTEDSSLLSATLVQVVLQTDETLLQDKNSSHVINCTADSSSLSSTSAQVVLKPHETLLQDKDQSPVINCTADSSNLCATSAQEVLQFHETLLKDESLSPVINCNADSSSFSATSAQVVLQPHEILVPDKDPSSVINCTEDSSSFCVISAQTDLQPHETLLQECSPRKMGQKWNLHEAELLISAYRKKIKILQQKNRRYKKKIESLTMLSRK